MMDQLYLSALQMMGKTFEILSQKVPEPSRVPMGGGYGYRFKEKSINQAVIQKLARVVTGLRGISVLNTAGLYQEQAALQRMLDEFNEDVMFLCFAIIFDDFTDYHKKYLDYFYQEEFDIPGNAIKSSQRRPMVPRKKIQAHINKDRGTGYNQSSSIEISRTLSKTYSGFVHGASPQIMELYFGSPPKFRLFDSKKSPFEEDHDEDLLNPYYTSILSFAFSAKAFGEKNLCKEVIIFANDFAIKSGRENPLRETGSSPVSD